MPIPDSLASHRKLDRRRTADQNRVAVGCRCRDHDVASAEPYVINYSGRRVVVVDDMEVIRSDEDSTVAMVFAP